MPNNVSKINNDQGSHLSILGGTYRIIIPGKKTDGEFAVIDMQKAYGGCKEIWTGSLPSRLFGQKIDPSKQFPL
jgi:hypothetical protein